MSLQEYLEDLKARSTSIDLGEYDPRKLPLDRRSCGFMGEYVVLGAEPDDPIAREKSREVMVRFYEDLKKRPDNIQECIVYAESLAEHFYYEQAEVLFGYALSTDSENPRVHHLLARNHINWAQLCRRKRTIAHKHLTLAKELGIRGLEITERNSQRLVEDVLDAATNLEDGDTVREYGKMLY